MFLLWISDLIDLAGWPYQLIPEHIKELQELVIGGYMQRPKYWRHVQNRAYFNLSL